MPGVAQPKRCLGFLELSRIVPTPSQNEPKRVEARRGHGACKQRGASWGGMAVQPKDGYQ